MLLYRLEQYEVTLPPDFVCERCTLQLIRQAIEFERFGWSDSVFKSCADVSIVDSPGMGYP